MASGLVFAAVIVGVGISLALSLTLLGLVTTRIARVEIDLEQRVLTLGRPLRRAVRLHLPEVAKIRSEGGSLLIEHATGVFWQDLRHLAPGELDGIAAELDAAARSGGADPEVRELRTRAKEALAEALPDQP